MQDVMSVEELAQLRGAPVYDSAGDKIGAVEEIFWDEQSEQPEWIGIGTGFFGTKRVLVPVQGASSDGEALTVPYAKEQVKDSPDIDGDEISESTQEQLYTYYALGAEARESGLPEGRADDAQSSVTRSEEELAVGKRTVEAGRVRLHKWVETEPVTADVELSRERAHIIREEIDQPVEGAELTDEEIGVTLREEQAVVGKQVVAKERVGIATETDTRTETVQDELRKERVEVEGDVER
jgi:uncharacterized protein (TIGR02271 family)